MLRPAYLEVLRGTLDPESPLAVLRGLVRELWQDIFNRAEAWYAAHVVRDEHAYAVLPAYDEYEPEVDFPQPTGLNINMMPIRLFDPFGRSLPGYSKQYRSVIDTISKHLRSHYSSNKIAYLTVDERAVAVGETHRRPGLHIERPGAMCTTLASPSSRSQASTIYSWGGGHFEEYPKDGIYMASTISNSCMIWPVAIQDPEEVSDAHGGIEHMRNHLGPGRTLKAGELCWFTDRTPHEALPIQAPDDDPDAKVVFRQFFRLVVGDISVWYSKHNTPNPLGVQPDARISDEDKFAE